VVETSASAGRPAWVYKRDGRLVPFEPDRISRALFAATESLGRPDAFLAQELADGVLHFLAAEADGTIPTTAQVADTVIKVVRELGQPPLAQAFADYQERRRRAPTPGEAGPPTPKAKPELVILYSPADLPGAVVKSCLRAYSLQAVFSRDLAAAQADGLLTLTGLETPLQLTSCLLEPPAPRAPAAGLSGSLVEAITEARHFTGSCLAIDGPEHGLADPRQTADYARELGIGLRAAGLRAVVNLNSATPPAWADLLAEGPLFAGHRPSPAGERLAASADALLEALLLPGPGPVRVDWHLGERDFVPEAAARLLRAARWAVESPALAFAFDRPKKPVPLAEGLDRRHAAVLLVVGLHLPRLAELAGPGGGPERFLAKLGSLTRLALGAAARKREFLRHRTHDQDGIHRGFLLDRARLVVVPVGLEAVVRALAGAGPCASRPALELARKVVQRLREVLDRDGPAAQLDACLDGADGFALEAGRPVDPGGIAGLTPWDAAAPLKSQLRAAGPLHAGADMGTVAVVVPEGRRLAAEEVADLLRWAGRQTDVVRLRFVRLCPPPQQLTAPWEAGVR
jgi:hypothetical protein